METQTPNYKRIHPPLPPNYVSLIDLRERWMQRQKQKKRDEDIRDQELHRLVEIRDDLVEKGEEKGVGDDGQLELKQQPIAKSVVRSNPNPNSCKPNSPPLLPFNHPKQAQVVRVVRQSKAPPFGAPKVESVVKPRGEVHSFGNKMEEKKKIVPMRNCKDGNFLVDDGKGNHHRKGVIQSEPERLVVGPNAVGEGKMQRGLEMEGKFAGLSLSSGSGEFRGGRLVTVKNRPGRIRGRYGGDDFGITRERTKTASDSGLVWVKKGEASEIGGMGG